MKKIIIVALLVLVLSLALSQVASAAISWCATDLAPMATVAGDRNAAQANHAESNIISVPSIAVSVDKGGTNIHK